MRFLKTTTVIPTEKLKVSLRLTVLLPVLFLLLLSAGAQTERPWVRFFQEVAACEDDDTGLDDETYETLCSLETNPLNINSATPDDLSRLPFLTERQIDDICMYVKRHGAMHTLGELQAVASLDKARVQLLSCFVVAGPPPSKRVPIGRLLSQGRSTLLATASVPLYERRGDNGGYLGYSLRHSLRYDFNAGDRLRFGFIGAQDSGEPFFSNGNSWGYDHYSFFLQMRNLGRITNLVVGHYRVQFGMGLVANTGLRLGKTTAIATLGRSVNAVSPTATRSVANYLQGVAATVRLADGAEVTAFASSRPYDATLNKSDGTVATLVKTGYHRTLTEMEKKNNTLSQTLGFNARLRKHRFHVGLTGIYTRFNRELKPNTNQGYKRYYPSGNGFFNIGADYGFAAKRFSVSGETAFDRKGNAATLNTVSFTPVDQLSFLLLHRDYSPKYVSLHSGSFSDGGRVANEHGAYLGATWKPSPRLAFDAYADYTYYPWMRYLTSFSSDAFDVMFSGRFAARHWTLSARYRLHTRQRDNADKTGVVRQNTHRARLKATFGYSEWWDASTQADFSLTDGTGCDRGVAVTQRFNVRWRWLKASVGGSWFVADSYASRLYVYEQGMLNTLSFPSLYGRGVRYTAMVRADLPCRLVLLTKIGVTDYFDRNTIGSGLQTIDRSSKADVDVQLRWSF